MGEGGGGKLWGWCPLDGRGRGGGEESIWERQGVQPSQRRTLMAGGGGRPFLPTASLPVKSNSWPAPPPSLSFPPAVSFLHPLQPIPFPLLAFLPSPSPSAASFLWKGPCLSLYLHGERENTEQTSLGKDKPMPSSALGNKS